SSTNTASNPVKDTSNDAPITLIQRDRDGNIIEVSAANTTSNKDRVKPTYVNVVESMQGMGLAQIQAAKRSRRKSKFITPSSYDEMFDKEMADKEHLEDPIVQLRRIEKAEIERAEKQARIEK